MAPSPALTVRALPGGHISPLVGKVSGYLEPEKRSVPEDVLPLQSVCSPAQTGLRDPGYKMAPSPAPAVRTLPGGHLSSGREGTWMSGARNGGRSQKLFRFCSLHSHLCRLVSEGPWTQDGFLTCFGSQSLPGSHFSSGGEGAQMSGAQNGGLSQKLCCF